MAHVVIVGSGFGGCTAIRELRKAGYDGHITLVSPRPEFFYYPSLIWVPCGCRTERDLRIDLTAFLDKHRVEHRAARATGLRPADNVLLTDGGEIDYDWLLIASGGRYLRPHR
jgi:sulfide:quinone oxidoreductase